jgi:hypothetical protein
MNKALVVSLSYFLSASCFAFAACPQALPTSDAGFCPTFQAAAQCHCSSKGLPKSMCQDMPKLYDRMISMFGTLERACAFQHDTDTQTCIDDWNCYRNGGKDSKDGLCSATGNPCQ